MYLLVSFKNIIRYNIQPLRLLLSHFPYITHHLIKCYDIFFNIIYFVLFFKHDLIFQICVYFHCVILLLNKFLFLLIFFFHNLIIVVILLNFLILVIYR